MLWGAKLSPHDPPRWGLTGPVPGSGRRRTHPCSWRPSHSGVGHVGECRVACLCLLSRQLPLPAAWPWASDFTSLLLLIYLQNGPSWGAVRIA